MLSLFSSRITKVFFSFWPEHFPPVARMILCSWCKLPNDHQVLLFPHKNDQDISTKVFIIMKFFQGIINKITKVVRVKRQYYIRAHTVQDFLLTCSHRHTHQKTLTHRAGINFFFFKATFSHHHYKMLKGGLYKKYTPNYLMSQGRAGQGRAGQVRGSGSGDLIEEEYTSAGKAVVQISLSYVCRYVFSERMSVQLWLVRRQKSSPVRTSTSRTRAVCIFISSSTHLDSSSQL